ncbi:MAG: hypothetical protein AAF518_08245 [Spirochaetota bacterium]
MRLVLIFIFLFTFSTCGDPSEKLYEMYHKQVSSVGDITDEMVVKYVLTYRNLRKFGIEFEKYLANDPKKSGEVYKDMEKIIIEGGFTDFLEFAKTNAKIAWAWNLAQARSGMKNQAKLQDWSQNTMQESIAMLQKELANPDVPESTKQELRNTMQQLQGKQKQLADNYQKNLKWANWAVKMTLPLTNEKDIAVILRHEKELLEVFTGLSAEQLDQINENTMEVLKIK